MNRNWHTVIFMREQFTGWIENGYFAYTKKGKLMRAPLYWCESIRPSTQQEIESALKADTITS